MPDPAVIAALDALPTPAILIDPSGAVSHLNRAGRARLGPGGAEWPDPAERERLLAYLARAAGTRTPLPGAVTLRVHTGDIVRFQCQAGVFAPARADTPAQVLLTLSDAADGRFSLLTAKVRELNAEIAERRRTQAVLERALADRDVMLRELHHRVKNNIQVVAGIVAVARREAHAPEARSALAEAASQLGAIGAVHQMFYRADGLESLDAGRFAADLSAAILRSHGAGKTLSPHGTPGASIPNDAATPLALILNELLSNAVKHAGQTGEVRVSLTRQAGTFQLSVEDDGPGFDPGEPTRRGSGLGLVRGLARQLGGDFAVSRGSSGGARCAVRFPGSDTVARDAAA